MVRRINRKPCRQSMKAMTLIELLIVIVIIGLLASWAYPSYTAYVRSAHRQQAQLDMQRIQLALEQHYQQGYHLEAVMNGSHCLVCQSDPKYYQFSVTPAGSGYEIAAQPLSAQHLDTCDGESYDRLTLNQAGQATPRECWR